MPLSLIKVNAADLQIGMYVSELDRPWVDTPFPLQGFHIRDGSDARKVQDFCRFVFIDVEKGVPPEDGLAKKSQHITKRKPINKHKIQPNKPQRNIRLKSIKYTDNQPLESELAKGEALYNEIQDAFDTSLSNLQTNDKVNISEAKGVVKQITESVIRNRDALVWLSKMKASHDASYSHAIRTSVLAASFGVHLGMKQDDIELLSLAVLLSDIGITKLSNDTLLIARKIELSDIPEYKTHIQLSIQILNKTGNIPPEIIPIIEAHHERLDGSGYPYGLAGKEIPVLSQIAGLVDEFDRMTSVRSHSSQVSPADGASQIYKMRSGAFNEQLVEEFIKAVGVYPAGTFVELSNSEVGIVIAQNSQRKLLPKVMILKDKDGKLVRKKVIVDLYKNAQAHPNACASIKKSLIDPGFEIEPESLTEIFNPDTNTSKKNWSLKSLFSIKADH